MTTDNTWSADVKVSMPKPIQQGDALVDMGGFAFTVNGLAHNITQSDLEEISSPTFSPPPADSNG